MGFCRTVFVFAFSFVAIVAPAQQAVTTEPQTGSIVGIVTDAQDALIPGASIQVAGDGVANQSVKTNDVGAFALNGLPAGKTLHLAVKADGFGDWASDAIVLTPGQSLDLKNIKLTVAMIATSVTAETPEQIATQQVNAEEHQRVLGIVPNFYVAYDGQFVPMTTGLKYRLALRTATDVATFAANGVLAGLDQADGASPHYRQGMAGFGQRYGASYTGTFTDVMVGAAILPSLLHQDPRYFYQGTGSKKSRLFHAVQAPFVAKGDNGRWQPNYSSIGGDLVSSSLTNLYYPTQDRGPGLVFRGALEITGTRIVNTLAQEFILNRFTSRKRSSTP